MTKQEAMAEAIKLIQGQPLFEGMICAHPSHRLACHLVRYEGDKAICFDGTTEHTFPRSEIFECKKMAVVANHLLNVGFWEEGMGCGVITFV